MKKSILLLSIFFISHLANAQPGSLDNTFGVGGMVTTVVGGFSNDNGQSIAVQDDGKILVAGYSSNGSDFDFALVRYNNDGSLDNSFDTDGKVTTAIGTGADKGFSVVVQSDGKILVAGYTDFIGLALVRYNSDGTLDNSFDSDGKVTTSGNVGYSVAIQSDGKILVGGNGGDTLSLNSDFALFRYNSNGSLDTTFDSDGKVYTDFGIGVDYGTSVGIQIDGKIVMAGYSVDGSYFDFTLVRYNSNGTLDNTFDSDGKVTTSVDSSNDRGYSVAIQSDGKILVGGYSNNGTNNDFALVRYNNNGSLDTTFNSDGKLTTAIGGSNDYGYSVAIQSDGKIVMAGTTDDNSFALVQYNSDGSLDNSFDTDGKVITSFGGIDPCYSVAIQGDGKIVAAGYADNGNLGFAVARYNDGYIGIEEVGSNPLVINIYPNPVSIGNSLIVSLQSKTDINNAVVVIYDMLGRICYNKQIDGIVGNNYLLTVNTDENFSSGMFFLQIEMNGGVIRKKLVVE